MTEPFENRRQHVRIYRNFILSCRLKGSQDVVFEVSQVNNISQGGMNFSSTVLFAQGNELLIELRTPFLSGKVDLEGTILGVGEKIPGLIYEIRVQFHDVSESAKEALVKIEQYSTQQKQE